MMQHRIDLEFIVKVRPIPWRWRIGKLLIYIGMFLINFGLAVIEFEASK